MKKRLLSTILALCLVLTILPLNALATDEPPVETGTGAKTQEEQSATPENPTPVAPTEATMNGQTTTPGSDNTDGLGNPLEEVPNDTILEEKSKALSEEASEPMPLVNLPTSGTCGANLTWRINGQTLTISGTGSMTDYESPSVLNMSTTPPWLYSDYEGNVGHMRRIQNVIIQDGVTSIGSHAFHDCEMTSITIPNSVVSIGEWAFASSNNLTELKLPNSITNIGNHAFYSMRSLNKINIPTSMTSLDGLSLFQFCSKLTSIEIPSNISKIDNGAFLGSSITNIKIPNSVKYIGDQAFAECDKLVKIDIPGSVTAIGEYAFRSCDNLTNVSIANGLQDIGDLAFAECTSLSDFTIPNTVKSTGFQVFDGCTKLKSVVISNSMDRIEQNFFRNCSSLTSVTIPASIIQIMQNAFYGCSNINDIYYSGTKSDWNNIDINETGNQYLDGVTVHCADGIINYSLGGSGFTDGDISQHSIVFHSGLGNNDMVVDLDWGWNLFNWNSTRYRSNFAVAGLALSNAAEFWQVNAESTLKNLGFTTIASENYERPWNEPNHPGVTFGYTKTQKGESEQHIFAIVVRGTTSLGDIRTDINSLGGGAFRLSSTNTFNSFINFVQKECGLNPYNLKGKAKFFVTGHSLGGAVTNIMVASHLNQTYGSENVFAYTFASPTTIQYGEDKGANNNIINIINTEDIIPLLPPNYKTRYGTAVPFSRWLYSGIDSNFSKLTNGKNLRSVMTAKNTVPNTVTKIMYSHSCDTYMSYLLSRRDAANISARTPRAVFRCPVDIEIYTSDNMLAGRIINNQIDDSVDAQGIHINIEGDEKTVYLLYEDEYTFRLVGTGNGTMEYSIEMVDPSTNEISSTETIFKNVELASDKKMISKAQFSEGIITGIDTPDIKLIVVDNADNPIKEVLPDGEGTEVYIPHTVTFDANGGTVEPATMITGTDGKLANLPTATRKSYKFKGWYTTADGGTQITVDTLFTNNTTVYAQWGKSNSNGGSGTDSNGANHGSSDDNNDSNAINDRNNPNSTSISKTIGISSSENTGIKNKSPNTGDDTPFLFWIFIMTILMVLFLTNIFKRNRNS